MEGETRSRVYRSVVTMEVLLLVPPDVDPPTDGVDDHFRDAVPQMEFGRSYPVPGEGSATPWEELTP